MTDTNQLPDPELGYIQTDKSNQPAFSARQMREAMKHAQQPVTPASVQADSSEHLRVIASLGAALRRLSFAAQTTGGTDGPDAELQSAIGQAEQALSLGGIGQAMFATTEPVFTSRFGRVVLSGPREDVEFAVRHLPDVDDKTTTPQPSQAAQAESEPVVSRNPFASRCYTMSESHLSGHRLIVGFEKLGDAQDAHEWVARQGRGDLTRPAPSAPEFSRIAKRKLADLQEQGFTITGYAIQRGTQRGFITNGGFVGWWRSDQAPCVPDDVVLDAARYRWLRRCRGQEHDPLFTVQHELDGTLWGGDLDAAIDAAMLAAKEAK